MTWEDDELAQAIAASMQDQVAMADFSGVEDSVKEGEITKEQSELFNKVSALNGSFFVWKETAAAFAAAVDCPEAKKCQEFITRFLVQGIRVFCQANYNEWCGEEKTRTTEDHTSDFTLAFRSAISLVLHSLEKGSLHLVEAAFLILDPRQHFFEAPAALSIRDECHNQFILGEGFEKFRKVLSENPTWESLPPLVECVQRHMPDLLETVLDSISARVETAERKDLKEFAVPLGKIMKALTELPIVVTCAKDVASGSDSATDATVSDSFFIGPLLPPARGTSTTSGSSKVQSPSSVRTAEFGATPPPFAHVAERYYERLKALSLQCTKSEKWSERRAALDGMTVCVESDKQAVLMGITRPDWIAEKEVLEDLFGERAHATIISETSSLLKVLKLTNARLDLVIAACSGEMGAVQASVHQVLLKIMKAMEDEHVIYIVEKANALLVSKADAGAFHLAITLCDTSHLRSVFDSVDALQKSEAVSKAAINFLTSALLSPYCTDPGCEDTFTRVLDSMIHCLKSLNEGGTGKTAVGESFRRQVIDRCINAIRSVDDGGITPTEGGPALIIESSSSRVKATFVVLIEVISLCQRNQGRPKLISSLQESSQLIEVVLQDIHRLCRQGFVGDMLKSELWQRLQQLRYLMEESPLVLTVEMVDSLWAGMREFSEICFRWLRLVTDTGSILGPGVAQEIFERYICKGDLATFGHHEWNCFEAYFGDVNSEIGSIQILGRAGTDAGRKINGPAFVNRRVTVLWIHDKKMHDGTINEFIRKGLDKDKHSVRWDDNGRVDEYDWTGLTDWHLLEDEFSVNLIPFEIVSIPFPSALLGFSELWDCALSVHNDDVSLKAAKLLLSIYKKAPSSFAEDFLSRVFSAIQTAHETIGAGSGGFKESLLLRRALGLVKTFLAGFSREAPSRAHGYSGRGQKMLLSVEYAMKTYSIRTHSRACFSSVLEQFAQLLAISGRLELSLGGTVINGGTFQTLEELGIADETIFKSSVIIESRPIISAWNANKSNPSIRTTGDPLSVDDDSTATAAAGDADSSADLMPSPATSMLQPSTSNEARYNHLFNCMDVITDAKLCAEVWETLMSLPTQQSIRTLVESAPQRGGSGDWSHVFGVESVGFWKSIYALQIVDSMLLPPEDSRLKDAIVWRRMFLGSGGFDHLLYFLRGMDRCPSWTAPHGLGIRIGLPVVFRILKFCVSGALLGDGSAEMKSSAGGGSSSLSEQFSSLPLVGSPETGIVRAFSHSSAMTVQDNVDMGEVVYLVMERMLHLCSLPATVDDLACFGAKKIPSAGGIPDATPSSPSTSTSSTSSSSTPTADAAATAENLVPVSSADSAAKNSCSTMAQVIAQAVTDGVQTLKVVLKAAGSGKLDGAAVLRGPVQRFLDGKGNVDASSVIHHVLLLHSDASTRAAVKNALVEVCERSDGLADSVLDLMEREFLSMLPELGATGTQFFEFLTVLCERSTANPKSVRRIGEHAISLLLTRAESLCDEVLVGLLKLLRALMIIHSDLRSLGDLAFVQTLFNQFLIRVPSKGSSVSRGHDRIAPICKTPEPRSACWDLLLLLVVGSPADCEKKKCIDGGIQELVQLVSGFVSQTRLPLTADNKEDWEHVAAIERRMESGFVGLINHGAICYMNAMVQQLFNIPPIRDLILHSAPSEATDESKEEELWKCATCSVENTFDSERCIVCGQGSRPELVEPVAHGEVLRQIQRTFCFLRDSELQSFDPKQLVESCRDLGLHFRVQAQNDTAEFLGKLLERLERDIGGKRNLEILDSFFRVRTLSQLVSVECPHRKPVKIGEYDKSLKVNVQRMTNLENAISKALQGELMTGDARVVCEECSAAALDGKAVSRAMRNTPFLDGDNLPTYLSIQLNRFKFQDMGYKKLNDRLSFPLQLNMAPYCGRVTKTEAGNVLSTADFEGEQLNYELTGVVVHSGEFGYGHYYSFVRDSRDDSEWYRLDDNKVSKFDIADLEKECFGGIQTVVNEHCWVLKQERKASAYMIFYRRLDPASKIQQALAASPRKNDTSDRDHCLSQTRLVAPPMSPGAILEGDMSDLKRALSNADESAAPDLRELEEEISDTNEQVLRRALLFDEAFSGFVLDFVNSTIPGEKGTACTTLELIAMATTVFFKSVLHSKSRSRLSEWLNHLTELYSKDLSASEWFLDRVLKSATPEVESNETAFNNTWLEGGLIKCPALEVRDVVKEVILSAVGCYLRHRSDLIETAVVALQVPPDLDASDAPVTATATAEDAGVLGSLVRALIALIPSAAHSFKQFQSYNGLWLGLAKHSPLLSQYLVRKDVIAHLVHMYLGVRSPADKEKTGLPSLPVMGSSSGGSFDDLINTITLLLATKERLPPLTSKLLEIHLVQRPVEPPSLPIMSNFAAKLVEHDPMGGSGVKECLLRLMCVDRPAHEAYPILRALVLGLEKSYSSTDPTQKRRHTQRMEALGCILEHIDLYSAQRVDFAMSELTAQANAKAKSAPYHFKRLAQAIVKLHELPLPREWLLTHREQWTWMSALYTDTYSTPVIMRTESARNTMDALREIQMHSQTPNLKVSGAGASSVNGSYTYCGRLADHGPQYKRLVGDTEFRVWRKNLGEEGSSWVISQASVSELIRNGGTHFYATLPTMNPYDTPAPDDTWGPVSGRKMEDPPPCVVQDEEMPPPLPPPSNATSAPNATAAVNSALMRGECNFCAKLSQSVKCKMFEPGVVVSECSKCLHPMTDHALPEWMTRSTTTLTDQVLLQMPQKRKSAKTRLREATLSSTDEGTEMDSRDDFRLFPWKCPDCDSEEAAIVSVDKYQQITEGDGAEISCTACRKVHMVKGEAV